MTEVRIKRRENESNKPFSEVFIEYDGRTFYSRVWWTIDDTAQARAAQLQDFLRRQARPFAAPLTRALP